MCCYTVTDQQMSTADASIYKRKGIMEESKNYKAEDSSVMATPRAGRSMEKHGDEDKTENLGPEITK